jgi:hypothetical protein
MSQDLQMPELRRPRLASTMWIVFILASNAVVWSALVILIAYLVS